MKIPSNAILRSAFFLAISAVCVGLDQLSKGWIKAFMEHRGGRDLTLIPGFAKLVYRFNTGGAFSLYDNSPWLFLIVPSILIVALLAALFIFSKDGILSPLGISFLLGGAAGNLIDRFRFGHVFDFMDNYIGNLHWPSYNVADSFIVAGMFLFIIAFMKKEKCDAPRDGVEKS